MNKWDKFYIEIAEKFASMSKDPKYKVGAILTSLDRRHIYAVGYNGSAIKQTNKRDSEKTGFSGMIHAEMNCFLKNFQPPFVSKLLYVTHTPCTICSKMIVNVGGIERVYYKHFYKSKAKSILSKAGIKLIKL